MDPTAPDAPDGAPSEPDDLDGCDIGDVTPDDDDTAEMRALFPDGVADEATADQWKELFGHGS